MLQATIRDSRGRVALLGGLGFSNTGVVQSSGEAMSSGRNAAAGGIVDTANATAADVAHNKGMPVAARGAGETACNIFHSSSVEAGTALATETPSQYTQGAAAAAARGTSFCSQVRPPHPSQPWAHAASFVSPWAAPAVAARYQRQYNPFTVYTSDSPYLTTQGFGATDDPIWKKWWFWTALGGTALAAAGTATYFVRKSR
jgi:hypothetical protein